MGARFVWACGAAVGMVGAADGQVVAGDAAGGPGSPVVVPAGGVVYDNSYSGASDFGSAAQIFEPIFSGYDIWVGDDFGTSSAFDALELSGVGFCSNGCVDPFFVIDFIGRIYDGLPNGPGVRLLLESDGFAFDGAETWTAEFGDGCLPAGEYFFAYAALNEFGSNGQTFFYQESGSPGGDDGWQWNPGGAFGFPDDLVYMTEEDEVTPSAPNALITGVEGDCGAACYADCNGDGELSVLDFVCFQGAFQVGDRYADCNGDGEFSVLDFVCFQGEFQAGCP